MAACPRCGAMNADGATACAACGSPLGMMAAHATTAPPMTMATAPPARPTGVAILSVLYFIGAALLALASVMFLAGGALFGNMLSEALADTGGEIGGGFIAAMGVMIGLFLLVLAALSGVTGWGMWVGKAWAWILALILTGFNALSSVGSLVNGEWSAIIGLAIAGFIIWYLLQPGVKAWFGRT